jgi:transposase
MNEPLRKTPRNQTRKGVSIRRYDLSTKRMVAENILSGRLTASLAEDRFNIPYTTILDWVRQFSKELEMMKKKKGTPSDAEAELEALKREKEELKKALEASTLKVTALRTMIDIAEKELKVDIRKKSGTKQSNS